jgi:hypothetical protein
VKDWNKIFEIETEADFETIALEVFAFQYENCVIYRKYVDLLDRKSPTCIEEIPFLPIEFFKSQEVLSIPKSGKETLFLSSGTGMIGRSKHLVSNVSIYEASFFNAYQLLFGNPKEQVILALLPNYLEQGNSSLVYMVSALIEASKNELSGFLLNEFEEIKNRYEAAINSGKEVVIFGVSYALLDLAEQKMDFSQAKIIETGGMKGRRKELTKAELHAVLVEGLGVDFVSSEYGMTELLSQAYSLKNGVFVCPPWMKVLFRDVYDPLTLVSSEKSGGINVIDLANINSCSFIQTQDLGRKTSEGFVIEGRIDLADIRGCNLMVG